MKALKVGIMPREAFQKRILDIAAGRYIPNANEPKIWFNSMKSLSEVLSENNMRLLKIIEVQKPTTMRELATLTGRQISNLSRTLKTMARYGIVEIEKVGRTSRPIAKTDKFIIEYRAVA